jgi:type IV pilus assembly protein PilE
MKAATERSREAGMTLIELLVVVTVLGVLVGLAMPSYEQYVLRGHRGQARATVLQAGQWLERAATAQGTYPAAAQVPADLLRVEGGRYTVVVATTTTSFTITATPSGRQATDGCGTFQVDHTGARSQLQVVGQPLPLTSDECWSR